jgi:signal transduction histidine kinase
MPQASFSGNVEPTRFLGIGIQGMRERIRQLRGRMEITSSQGRGTTIAVTIPDTLPANPNTKGPARTQGVGAGNFEAAMKALSEE